MKKVAVILKGYPRSDEIFIVQELVELERHGFELTIYSLVKPEDKVLQRIHQLLKARVVYVPRRKKDLKPSFVKVFLKKPLRTLELWGQYRAQAVVENHPLKRLLQALWIFDKSRGSFDLIYSHFANAPSEVGMGIEVLSKKPWFVFAHAKDIHQTPTQVLRQRLGSAKIVFACNKESFELLSQTLNQVKLIYHGVNTELLVASRSESNGSQINLYSAGRLVEKKGHDFILKVLSELKVLGIPFHFKLFGDGPLRTQLETLSSSLGLNDCVDFHGAYTLEALSSHVKKGSLYLGGFQIAEDRDRDGLPNTLLEAMYLGSIPVCRPSAAIREVLLHEKNGFIVEGSAREWALQIKKISELTLDSRNLILTAARRTIEQDFDFANCCQGLIAEFKSA